MAWLRTHPDGRQLLREAVDDDLRVLFVQCADVVEIYANRPFRRRTKTRLSTTWPEHEVMADELMDLELPKFWRRIYEPCNYLGYVRPERRTVMHVAWEQARRESADVAVSLIRGVSDESKD